MLTRTLLIGLVCLGSVAHAATQFKNVSEIHHASDADYIFLEDTAGKEWIYKQMKSASPDDQMCIVLESLASDIAEALDFPINYSRLISGTDDFSHRILNNFPGSLHLKVAGKPAEESLPWTGFILHQRFRTPYMIRLHGVLEPQEIGLTREIIQNMSKHPDLPKIAAFDTYLGNNDRSNPNVFYDSVADRFYGIDLGNCFMGDLALSACTQLEQMLASGPAFSDDEKRALLEYRYALNMLLSRFPPTAMINLLNHHLKHGGFVASNPVLWNEDAEQRSRKWKRAIDNNYQQSLKLEKLIIEITGVK